MVKRWSFFIALVFVGSNLYAAGPAGPVANEDEFLLSQLWETFRSANPKQKVGLALGGGGARGLAHIGVLKALEEEDVPVHMIAGTSVGALIGALYSAGTTTGEMEEMSSEIGWSALTNYSRLTLFRLLVSERQLSTSNMEIYLRKHMGERRFDQLRIPFACIATDLQTGERVVFREGSVALAARASATIPGLFEPVLFRHRYLVDGGLVSNIPTDLVKRMGADTILAVDVTADFSKFQPRNILAILNQAIYIQSESMSKDELSHADIVIRPQLGDISAIDLTRSAESIDSGTLSTRAMVPQIKRLLIDRSFKNLMRSSGRKA